MSAPQETTLGEAVLNRMCIFFFPPYKRERVEFGKEETSQPIISYVDYSVVIGVIVGCIYAIFKWSKYLNKIFQVKHDNPDEGVEWVPEPPEKVKLGPIEVLYPDPVADLYIEQCPTLDPASDGGSSPTSCLGSTITLCPGSSPTPDRCSSPSPDPDPASAPVRAPILAPARAQAAARTPARTRVRSPGQKVEQLPVQPAVRTRARTLTRPRSTTPTPTRARVPTPTRARTPSCCCPAAVAKILKSPRDSSGARKRPPRWVN